MISSIAIVYCHVQSFVAIILLEFEIPIVEIPINLNYDGKIR